MDMTIARLYRIIGACGVALAFAGLTCSTLAQSMPPLVVAPTTAPHLSRFDSLAQKSGLLVRKEHLPLAAATNESIPAEVVRLEDVTAAEVVYALQVTLPEHRGVATFSEEELADVKDSVDYIVKCLATLNAAANPTQIEYRALSGARVGYSIHRRADTGEELPATAYFEVPVNPYFPQFGGFLRLPPQTLQKIVGEAKSTIDAAKEADGKRK